MSKKPSWHVRLGKLEWERHTYARADDDALYLLGSVRRRLQIGALARTADGAYCQVVVDFIIPLNKGKIEKALASTETTFIPRTESKPVHSPIVVVKRRRIPVVAE